LQKKAGPAAMAEPEFKGEPDCSKKNYASTAEEQPQQNNDRYRYAQ
jgi:hypothetical protein